MDLPKFSNVYDADRPNMLSAFAGIAGSVVVAIVLRLILAPALGASSPFITFFLAVIFTSWLLGFWSGVAASALSELAVFTIFVPHKDLIGYGAFRMLSLGVVFFVESMAIAALGEGLLYTRAQAQTSAKESQIRAERADSLNMIGKAIRAMSSSSDVHKIALEQMSKTLNVDRALVILLDEYEGIVRFAEEWHRPGLPDLVGSYSLKDFDVDLNEVFPQSAPLVVADVDNFQKFSELSSATLRSMQIRALIDVPISFGGTVVSVLGAYMSDSTRNWTPGEVSFVEAVASQLRSGIETIRSLTEAQERADREALVNRIGREMRGTSDPEDIQGTAVSILGQALEADRCYFAIYDLDGGIVTIGKDWHREDLPPVCGVHSFPNTAQMFGELYPVDATSIVEDRETSILSEQTKLNMIKLQLRSRVSVAVADTRGMATLTAAMSDLPRKWTTDEIKLIEMVASHLRPTVEMARVQQREHRIATDLQAALLPELPPAIPGLLLSAAMQPALDEAEIGGDFFDVYSLDKELYAIVIGDVSGKGLAAAAQLATLRNSLRMGMYLYQTPSVAISTVNAIMTTHELLTGFVTLFVGVYDAATCTINYSSAGHEPGLIYRSLTKSTEVMLSEGIPIGVTEAAEYPETAVTLGEGDTIMLYTDGLSESGPTRKEMTGTEGLVGLLGGICQENIEAELAQLIVEKARVQAGGSFRDDVCVLTLRCQARK
jgi:serine phosphatase RsbU (regulator of sigma subunit)